MNNTPETNAGRPWMRALFIAGLAYAALVAAGIVAVAARTPTPTTPATHGAATASTGDLALAHKGARVRVSSYHSSGNHHPIFLIDGQRRGELTAKWVSAPSDRQPWIELLLPETHDLSMLRIAHAGIRESKAYTMPRYTIACSNKGQEVWRTEVKDNKASLAKHRLECPGTNTLRLSFALEPIQSPRGVARLFELELFAGGVTP